MKNRKKLPKSVYVIMMDEKPIYVGSTTQKIEYRLAVHKCVHPYISQHRDEVSIFEIDVIKSLDELWKENYWIDYYVSLGFNLLNKQKALWLEYEKSGDAIGFNYNKEYATEYYRMWREKNKLKWRNYMKEYKRKESNEIKDIKKLL
jgi:hypothetical protein